MRLTQLAKRLDTLNDRRAEVISQIAQEIGVTTPQFARDFHAHGTRPLRSKPRAVPAPVVTAPAVPKRRLSASARKRIAASTAARWVRAKKNGQNKLT